MTGQGHLVGYGLGVDLGTTYTAAAVQRDGRVEIVRLGSRRAETPSVLFVPADGPVLVGEAAVRRGASTPGRLAREFKRRVGDPVPILVGGAPHSAHALMARLLEHVLRTVTAQHGEPPAAVTVAHPANWGPYKRELFEQAIRLADVRAVRLCTEPEAVAVQFAAGERMQPGEIIAVYDLGGGTFDAAVLRRTATGFELLGEPEGIEQLGGIDFDEAVFGHVVSTLGEEPKVDDDEGVAALARLRRDCVEAKESLSEDTEVMIPVALPGLHTRIRLNRHEFEEMITPALTDTVAAMRRALRSAQVQPAQLRGILLGGGSSRIPLVSQVLGTTFDRPVLLDPDPEHAVALGAARLTAGPAVSSARSVAAPAVPVAPVAPIVPAAPTVPAAPGAAGKAAAGAAPAAAGAAPAAAGAAAAGAAAASGRATVPAGTVAAGGEAAALKPAATAGPGPAPATAGPGPAAATAGPGPAAATARPGPGSGPAAGVLTRLSRRGRLVLMLVPLLLLASAGLAFAADRALRPDPPNAASAPPTTAASTAATAPAPVVAAQCGFTDDFAGTAIDPAWERVRPDAPLVVAGGTLEMTAPEGSDIYNSFTRAPRLLRALSGDFVIETEVSADPKQLFHGAGLVLWDGPTRYVRLERGYGDVDAVLLEYKDRGNHIKVHPPNRGNPKVIRTDSDRVSLQLRKTDTAVRAAWRTSAATPWRDLGSIPIRLPDSTKAGIAVLNRAQGGNQPLPFRATFEQVRVSC